MDNHVSDASGRLDDELVLAGVKPTPLAIFNYWDQRGRNSADSMRFHTAIREFLAVRPAAIRNDAVYFYGRKYRSAELVATGIFDRVAKEGVIKTTAYILTMCVRHIWIEVGGRLYELDFVRSQRTLEGTVDISLRDLQLYDQMRRKGNAALCDEIPAAQQHFRDRLKQEIGEDWHAGDRRTGRPAKNASAQRDAADYERFIGKAK
jgi:hypothetical protein